MEYPRYVLNSLDAIRDLTPEELQQVASSIEEEQQDALLRCLQQLNGSLGDDASKYDEKIKCEKKIVQILLRKVWRNLDKEKKKECASFFKELSNEIDK